MALENPVYYISSGFLDDANTADETDLSDNENNDKNLSNHVVLFPSPSDDQQEHSEVYENSVDMRKVFNDDPLLHQDIINYLGTRPMREKIFMAKTDLLPELSVQIFTILCFWMVNCGLCCILCAIVGMTTTRFEFNEPLKLLKQTNLKVSWIFIWTCGVILIVLNFITVTCALLICSCTIEQEQEKCD